MELVKITINANGVEVVSAKELYDKLGFAAQHYSKWYKKNIENNKFAICDEDYTQLPLGGRYVDFALTFDFAKRLSQLARTEEGEQVRNYFIACEKALKQAALPSDAEMELMVFNRLKQTAVRERQLREAAESQLELANLTIMEQVPAVEYATKVLLSEGYITITTIAKELGMSAMRLNKILHDRKIIWSQNKHWVLYSKYQDCGYTKTKTHPYVDNLGQNQTAINTYWTEAGRQFIHRLLNKALTA